MKRNKLYWILAGVCLANLLGHAACLPMMPDKVPIHWNWAGVADGFGSKYSALGLGALPLGLLLLFWAKDGSGAVGMLVGGGIGILFILLGNYMPRIKQNYTFGCRTPWALADEHNWNRTQRMGGFTFIVIGAATLVAGVFSGLLGPMGSTFVLLGATILGTIWIFAYSFLVFKGLMK